MRTVKALPFIYQPDQVAWRRVTCQQLIGDIKHTWKNIVFFSHVLLRLSSGLEILVQHCSLYDKTGSSPLLLFIGFSSCTRILFVIFPLILAPQPLLRYRGLGCFNDGDPPAWSELAKNFRNEGIDWSNIDDTIQKCAKFVFDNFPDNKMFALEFYGECWTGREAEHSYDKYGASSECWNNVGKEHAFYAYEFY